MKKRSVSRLLCFALVCTYLLLLLPGKAWAVSQEEIDELRKERLAIAEEHEEKQAKVDELEEQKASVVEKKKAMDERNEFARKEIESIEREISLYDQIIAEEAIKVEQAKAVEEKQLERYRARVRAMEEYGEMNYLSLILNVNSLSELLTAMDDAGDIMKSDVELYDDYMLARQNTEAVKAEYENYKSELKAEEDVLLARKAELEKDIEEAAQLIRDLEEDIDIRNAELHDLLLAEIEVAERIDELVAEQERERMQAAMQSGASVGGSGSWAWPCPSCSYITSRFGNRLHPILNEWRYHSGLDIGASYGSAVTASDGGTVIMASVNGGYGNCVMINHGNGYYSLYGHLSGYAVSEGEAVGQGQVIGYVGDTGLVTGPHLHFEIRYGSEKLDPEAVGGFYGLTYAPDAGE